jgi:hypothetical protein
VGIDSRGSQARDKDTSFDHQFPPGCNRSVLAESSTSYPNVGQFKRSNRCHYRGLPLDNSWYTGQTKDNPQSRHHVYTTDHYYSMLNRTSRSNTIALSINTERRTHKFRLGLTNHGIKYATGDMNDTLI